MSKTNPIGVRFNEELLKKVKESGIAASPQKALILYEKAYVESINQKVVNNTTPEAKTKIEKKKDTEYDLGKKEQNPVPEPISETEKLFNKFFNAKK